MGATTRRALSIAASQAAGLRENFGTMTKPFHAGRAAETGVIAADLAALGWTASPTGSRGRRGFFRAAGGGYGAEMIHARLGNPWTFACTGDFDQAPSERLAHPSRNERDAATLFTTTISGRSTSSAWRSAPIQHADRAHSPSAGHRAASQVQHGVLHGDPADLRKAGLENSPMKS